MNATDIQQPPSAAAVARPVSAVARLAWLHVRSRRALAALVALLACGVALWASLRYHWWLGTGNAADELPMILQGCAAGIIAVTMHSPFGEPERAAGRRLAVLRAGLVLALCGAAIGLFALGAAVAYSPRSGVYLAGGILPVARNVLGVTGIGLIFCLATGALIAWTGPLAFTAISQFALIANHSWPITWPARPPADRGGWIAALVAFAVGLIAFTIRGPRIRQSGELCPADGQRSRANPRSPTTRHRRPGTRDTTRTACPVQHYAFLVTKREFDEILGRIEAAGQDYWADPGPSEKMTPTATTVALILLSMASPASIGIGGITVSSCLVVNRGAGGCPAGERDDATAAGVGVAELLVFQGELVDCADKGGDVGPELGEFPVLALDRLPEPGDGGAEPGLVLVVCAAFPDSLIELVLQVGVTLGERVAGNA